MLRFLLLVTVCLLVAFTGMSAALSRAWGWNEYASDELYVVYQHLNGESPHPYFLVNADGSGERWKFEAENEQLMHLACSPDGRTLALLSNYKHISVVNSSGIVYDQVLTSGYEKIGVTNRLDAYLFWRYSFNAHGDLTIVGARQRHKFSPPDDDSYNNLQMSSSGSILWGLGGNSGGTKVTASSGEINMILPKSFSQAWLSSEDIFTFSDHFFVLNTNGRQYLADPRTQNVVQIPPQTSTGVFSPDTTRIAVGTWFEPSNIFITDVFSRDHRQQLTYDGAGSGEHGDYYYVPICFLTFRPEMLLRDSP